MGAMKVIKRFAAAGLCTAMVIGLAGCSSDGGTAFTGGKRIIRISHAQSETHPEHIGLLAFKEYIEENLGDKYEVEIYPNELLGDCGRGVESLQCKTGGGWYECKKYHQAVRRHTDLYNR